MGKNKIIIGLRKCTKNVPYMYMCGPPKISILNSYYYSLKKWWQTASQVMQIVMQPLEILTHDFYSENSFSV